MNGAGDGEALRDGAEKRRNKKIRNEYIYMYIYIYIYIHKHRYIYVYI